ncbi:AI-2E family transporter [Arthrobacter pityocampae]|uniref:AI-2E family transporter n=1 Tax=Arthrobacter pityocampae TaxID=547334 RepID=A0A2S5IYL5_9MICC|nr:AI-2E family transporter [Arthrobacter pityocampae]PPB49644.1 AI-2E family transporter [Arthrobacter pityocampae]
MQRLRGAKPQRALQRAVSRGAVILPEPSQRRGAAVPLRADDRSDVPYALRIAASWAWRLGLVVVVGGVLIYLLTYISVLIIPLMVAGLLAALLTPLKIALHRRRVPNGLAVAITLVGFFGVITGALVLVGQQLVVGMASLWGEAVAGVQQLLGWLAQGPLQLSATQIDQYLQDLVGAIQNNSASILSGALSFGSTAGHVAAGIFLTVFALIFFLLDGPRIWRFVVGLMPLRARAAVDGAGRTGWLSMARYVRVQILVAAVDAIGIGAGAAIIGVPLALPLGVLVFLGSFIPVVGALATGSVAVLLALVANGWVNALIMLAIVLLVQQIEGHILQPLVMGPAVALHPLAVVLAVAGGTIVAGIPGALFSVPILAVLNASVRYISRRAWEDDDAVLRQGWPQGGGGGISGPVAGEHESPSSPASTPDQPAAPAPQEETTP